MEEKISIREMEPRDHERVLEIALVAFAPVYAEDEQILGEELFAWVHPDWREEKKHQIQWAFQKDTWTVLVAERDNVVIGFVTFGPNYVGNGGEIGNNAVHPDYQRQGVSQLLYREVLRRMHAAGYKYVTVNSGDGDTTNLPAFRAYKKAGFNIALPSVEYFRRL